MSQLWIWRRDGLPDKGREVTICLDEEGNDPCLEWAILEADGWHLGDKFLPLEAVSRWSYITDEMK